MGYESILYEEQGEIGILTLNMHAQRAWHRRRKGNYRLFKGRSGAARRQSDYSQSQRICFLRRAQPR